MARRRKRRARMEILAYLASTASQIARRIDFMASMTGYVVISRLVGHSQMPWKHEPAYANH